MNTSGVSTEEPPLPDWDVNLNGLVNMEDIMLVVDRWGQRGQPGWVREDVNNDGRVVFSDVVRIAQHYGEIGFLAP